MSALPKTGIHVPETYSLVVLDTPYDPPLRGFRVGAAGDVAVKRLDGTTVVIPSLQAGETFRGMVLQINETDTTVTLPTTNIVVFR